MKGLLSKAPGGPETLVLDDLPDPVAGAGQVVVAVKACAINYPDVLIIEDKYQFKPARPFAPGGEIAGVVESVGEGVTGWKAGDRVIGMVGNGGLVEKVAV
ncbi:MAG: NADPH:quinone oxidoreductase, partial [Sphingomonas bacterium]|nr:NADPH:quinone oxidoreductase [Sphingomonas bacterium]